MELNILKLFGQVAGIAGLALGILFFIFRDIIQKKIFKEMNSLQSFKIIRLIIVSLFLLSVLGIIAWVYTSTASNPVNNPKTLDSLVTYKPIQNIENKINQFDLNVQEDSIKLRFRSHEFHIDSAPFFASKSMMISQLKNSIINFFDLEKNMQYHGDVIPQDVLWKVFINNLQIEDEQQTLAALGVKNNDWISLGAALVLMKMNIPDTVSIPRVKIPDSVIRSIKPATINTHIQTLPQKTLDSTREIRKKLNGQTVPRIHR